jgi:hypothetical protein
VNGNEIYFDMTDRLAVLIRDSSMDATKTVKTVYGTFVIVRRWIQRFISTMYHKYVERNDRHANHKQPIFLAILYRLRNSVLKESHRRDQTSTSEDQTPQNWAYSSEKHAIVFIVPRHQHDREEAEDKGEHQAKPNPNVLHRNLDTEGALSSQDRWPAWIVDHGTGSRIVQKLRKPHSTTRMEGSVKRLELLANFWQIAFSELAPVRGKVRIAASLLV